MFNTVVYADTVYRPDVERLYRPDIGPIKMFAGRQLLPMIQLQKICHLGCIV